MKSNKKIKHVNDLPAWFDLTKYKAASSLDAAGWFNNLLGRSLIYDRVEAMGEDSEFDDLNDEWNEIKRNPICAERINFEKGDCSGVSVAAPFALAAKLLRLGPEETQMAFNEAAAFTLFTGSESSSITFDSWEFKNIAGITDCDESEILHIDMHLPDDVLIEDFKEWLKSARISNPAHATTRRARQQNFALWVNCGVLPYIDLSIWAKTNGVNIPDRVFADAIFPNGDGGEDKVRKTTAPTAKDLLHMNSVNSLATYAARSISREGPENNPA